MIVGMEVAFESRRGHLHESYVRCQRGIYRFRQSFMLLAFAIEQISQG